MPHLGAGGRRLHFEWIGPSPDGAPTLVFLHEGLGSVSAWRDVPERLSRATGWGALVYSRWGYGLSERRDPPWPLDFMEQEARVLPEVLEAAGVRQAVLVGHSDGASIALVYAAAAPPPALRGVILEAPHVFCEDVTVRRIEQAVDDFRAGGLRRALERHHTHVDAVFAGWSGAWLDPGFRAWTITGLLPAVRVPVMVIQGEDDEYGTRRHLEAVAHACPGPVRTLLPAACGHAPHRNQPERTLAAMARFVAALGG